jgi:hypothetical protein
VYKPNSKRRERLLTATIWFFILGYGLYLAAFYFVGAKHRRIFRAAPRSGAPVAQGSTRLRPNRKSRLQLLAWSHKSEYRVDEPIRIDMRIVNVSYRPVLIDRRLVFCGHISATISDDRGNPVPYLGSNLYVCPAPARPTDFVVLLPGGSIGAVDIAGGIMVMERQGSYTIQVSYGDVGAQPSWQSVMPAWSGVLMAVPIKVRVRL